MNQIHPPSSKKKSVDNNGNHLRKLWLKDGNTTMLFYSGLTSNEIKYLKHRINDALMDLKKKPMSKNRFIDTQ